MDIHLTPAGGTDRDGAWPVPRSDSREAWKALVEQDREWIERCLAGDESGFECLLQRYRHGVYSLAYRMLGNNEDANDAAQEVFVRAFTSLEKYDPRFKFSSWIYRIASNFCVDQIRRRKATHVSFDQEDEDGYGLEDRLADGNPDPSKSVENGEREAILRWAIEQLEPMYRAVILLRHDQDLSYEEIASILGLPLGTVKVRVHRARLRLRDLLAPYMGDLMETA
jgi:RNA polymerase sigma-70 factor (ECF subfamily)